MPDDESAGPDREGSPDAPESGPAPDRAGETPPASAGSLWVCDLCGGPMLERHCRLVCTRCGYQRDCSDP